MKLAPSAVATAALLLLALTGCSTATPEAPPTTAPTEAAADGACAATEVAVQVDFGSLDADQITECAPAGVAADVLDAAGITTEGTADYGDQVVCRVDDLPAPDVETCATLPADGYWALWIKADADSDWAYAEEGVATQQVDAGQSLGLVYTVGADSVPPID